MKKLPFVLMLIFPLVASAQFDDIYFVPKKEKKVILSNSARDNSFVDVVDEVEYVEEDIDVVDELYYTNDPYEYYDNDDYRYSTRIIRFRNPGRLLGSSLYWDLRYNCGINDWMVYDNGHTIDIYPTYNNPAYFCSYIEYMPYGNWWSWNRWHSSYFHWNDYYWGYEYHYPSYYWYNHHHHFYGGYHPPYFANSSWRPKHNVQTDIPVNNPGKRVPGVSTNSSGRGDRVNNGAVVNRGGNSVAGRPAGQSTGRRPSDGTVNMGNRRNDARSTGVKRQTVERNTVNMPVSRQNNGSVQGVRKPQPERSTSVPVRNTDNVRNVRQRGAVSNARTNQQRQSGSQQTRNGGDRSSYRSKDSSSGEYNRPSSTSVMRQRSSSSTNRPSSGSTRSGNNSRSSSGQRGSARR